MLAEDICHISFRYRIQKEEVQVETHPICEERFSAVPVRIYDHMESSLLHWTSSNIDDSFLPRTPRDLLVVSQKIFLGLVVLVPSRILRQESFVRREASEVLHLQVVDIRTFVDFPLDVLQVGSLPLL